MFERHVFSTAFGSRAWVARKLRYREEERKGDGGRGRGRRRRGEKGERKRNHSEMYTERKKEREREREVQGGKAAATPIAPATQDYSGGFRGFLRIHSKIKMWVQISNLKVTVELKIELTFQTGIRTLITKCQIRVRNWIQNQLCHPRVN